MIWKVLLWAFEYLIKMPLRKTNNAYFSLFEYLLKFLKKFGVVGELIFTLYGLVWLMWPLVIGFLVG